MIILNVPGEPLNLKRIAGGVFTALNKLDIEDPFDVDLIGNCVLASPDHTALVAQEIRRWVTVITSWGDPAPAHLIHISTALGALHSTQGGSA